jgi:hypothetical protein
VAAQRIKDIGILACFYFAMLCRFNPSGSFNTERGETLPIGGENGAFAADLGALERISSPRGS